MSFCFGAAQAALNLSVVANPDPVSPGEAVNVQLTVSNSDASPRSNLTLQLAYPSDLAALNQAFITGGGTCPGGACNPGELVTWNLGTLAPGTGVTVFLPPTVNTGGLAPADGTTISFDAELLESAVSVATASGSTEVQSAPVLDLALDEDVDPAAAGDLVTYTLTYGNRSAASVTNTALAFPLPVNATLVSSTGGTQVGNEVQWSLGTLVAGQSAIQKVVVQVDLSANDGDQLLVDAATLSGTAGALPAQATAKSVTRVESNVPLSLSVEMNPDPAQPGEAIHTELTVTNTSASPVFGATLTAHFPEGVAALNQAFTTGGGTCPGGSCNPRELVTWNLGTLAPGAGISVSLPPTVGTGGLAPADGELITLDAQVSEDGGRQAAAGHTVVVESAPVLDLALDENFDPAAPGELLTYTLTYGNRSAASVTGTTLAFPLPVGSTLVSSTGGGTQVGDEVQWSLATLVAGQSAVQKVVVEVDAAATDGDTLRVDAATLSGQSSFIPRFARATSVTRVESSVPLSLSVEMNPDPAQPGEAIQTELTVTNTSASPVFGATLLARFPEGVAALNQAFITGAATCPGGSCNPRELVSWNLGTLAPGAGVTVSLPPTVGTGSLAPADGELILLDAEVSEDGGKQVLASHTVVVESAPVLDLALDEDFDPAAPGDLVTYTLTYGNRSAASVTGTTLAFPLPVGSTLVSSTGGGTQVGDEVQWSLATLVAGESAVQKVVVEVDAAATDGDTLRVDAATLSGQSSFIPRFARATSVTRVESSVPLRLSVDMNPDPAQPGEAIHTELTVTNTSASPVFGATLLARFPEGVAALSQTLLTGGGTCPGGSCNPRELVTWNLGTLAPGAGVTLFMAPRVGTGGLAPDDAELIMLDAQVSEDGGKQVLASHTVVVESAPVLDLALDEDVDPVAAGDLVTYTLTFGNRSAAAVSNATLAFPLPVGATLVSSTGGTQVGDEVQWALGNLAAGEGSLRRVVVSVDAAAADGDLLTVNAAELAADTTRTNYARATATTRVATDSPLQLAAQMSPNPVQPGGALNIDLTLTNAGASVVFGAVLLARYPDSLPALSQSLLTGGGTCPGGSCNPGEPVTWNLGTLNAGDSVTVSIPTSVSTGSLAPPDGSLINLLALATEDSRSEAVSTRAVLVGPFVDNDSDGTADNFDNCLGLDNPGQEDSNGDGFGNLCDPDLDNDLAVNFADLAIMKSVFFTTDADADLNSDGGVNFSDLAIMKSLFFSPPGPSALAP